MTSLLILLFLSQIRFFCTGEAIHVLAGEDVILPCSLKRSVDPIHISVEWYRTDWTPVYVTRDGLFLPYEQDPLYKDRVELFKGELKNGNVSLKLSRVRLEDEGNYTCLISLRDGQNETETKTVIQLIVGVGPLCMPKISIVAVRDGGVVLQCESSTWYPHPWLEWRDREGHNLTAEVTSDFSYGSHIVRSNVTVWKSNTFICRVHLEKINHTRETAISVLDDFFKTQCRTWVNACYGLVVVVVILIALAVGIYCKYAPRKTSNDLRECASSRPCVLWRRKGRNTTIQRQESDLEVRNTTLQRQESDLEVRNTTIQIQESDLEARNTTIQIPESDLEVRNTTIQIPESDLEARNTTLQRQESDLEVRNTTIQIPESDLEVRNTTLQRQEENLQTYEHQNKEPNCEMEELKEKDDNINSLEMQSSFNPKTKLPRRRSRRSSISSLTQVNRDTDTEVPLLQDEEQSS